MVAMTESDRNIVLVLHALGKEAVGKDLTIAPTPINGPAIRFCTSRIITAAQAGKASGKGLALPGRSNPRARGPARLD